MWNGWNDKTRLTLGGFWSGLNDDQLMMSLQKQQNPSHSAIKNEHKLEIIKKKKKSLN